ncbi:hypothetical protein [Mesorhizobium sp. Mes31]|uniref:hypothetical protein n=1 Tax=Mesorhizobium sp. Mes31 TaxID=2926017 RepID=UPI0021188B5F|nr:hypothetical protein [Mesorhizobium sp. Mes31]
MSEREFNKVSPAIWRSRRFTGLTEREKFLFLYLVTNAHVTSGGCYELPDGYACVDLDWQLGEYREARAALVTAGLVDVDDGPPVIVLIERWFKHNPPMNDDHAKGAQRRLKEIGSQRLQEKALAAFYAADVERVKRSMEKAAERDKRAEDRARRAMTAGTNGYGGPAHRGSPHRA